MDLRCPECDKTNFYTRVDRTIVCRTCGMTWKKEGHKKEEPKKETPKKKSSGGILEDDLGDLI